ncbi:flagellar biosynthesis protein FlgA [Micrococcus sp. IITD107]|uniref:flagellar biosynthesis protein FlgA n=1 Tax=Micrococcus sp. IITD107 TaxID=3342790 RepID=UPI0035BAC145
MEAKNDETPRLRRPSWKDPRLAAGILLVVLSVVGVVMLVRSVDHSEGYWVASQDLVPGREITQDQLTVVQAQLGDAAGLYLHADEPAPVGSVVQGAVRRGELLPSETVAEVDPAGRQPVAVSLQDPLPAGVEPGDRVDLWIAEAVQNQEYSTPVLVAESAELAEVGESSGAFGASTTTVVQILLGPEQLPTVLEAKANGAKISVVPSVGAGTAG